MALDFLEKVKLLTKKDLLPREIEQIFQFFYPAYIQAAEQNHISRSSLQTILFQFLDLVLEQLKTPFIFDIYHQAIKKPFNYYQFGLDFFRPLIIFKESTIKGYDQINKMIFQLKNKENVILLANHQTEPDPQIISLLLEKNYSAFAEKMIFVAGHRVTSDPIAVPFSLGRNLICIYSKRYINDPPEKKGEKTLHNQRALKKMHQLLREGGACIYVAPSGGRDRPDKKGNVEMAPFDPQSIELLLMMSQKTTFKTHFYPLALFTYPILSPPNQIQKKVGEQRLTHATPVHIAFGPEIGIGHLVNQKIKNKNERNNLRAQQIWKRVNDLYKIF